MRLMMEMIGMLEQGASLSVHRMVARRGYPLRIYPHPSSIQRRSVKGGYVYDVTNRLLDADGITTTYIDLEEAAASFAGLVGRVALSAVLGEKRYAHFFPVGSTLDWCAPPTQLRRSA